MNLSKLKNIVAGRLNKIGSDYTSNEDTFKAVIAKANVSYDQPTQEFTLLAGYNASINAGYLIEGQGDYFIPTKIDKPITSGGNEQYIRGYLNRPMLRLIFQLISILSMHQRTCGEIQAEPMEPIGDG